jgi:REP element-mobilizing transposase RayT
MQRIRLTYPGDLYHAMNRGHGGEKIFSGPDLKKKFIEILSETSRKLKIGNIAYCLLDNHYHLVAENSSGRLSEFFNQLNGRYGIHYRKKMGGGRICVSKPVQIGDHPGRFLPDLTNGEIAEMASLGKL